MRALEATRSRLKRSRVVRPPGPVGIPPLGMLPALARDPLEFMGGTLREYGQFTFFRIGPMAMYLLSDPALIEQVLLTRHKSFIKDEVTRHLSLSLGEGLLTSEGETWRRQRRLVAPKLRKKHIEVYGECMVKAAASCAAGFEDGSVRDVHEDMMEVTLEIVAETLFGADVSEKATQIGETIEFLMGEFITHVRSWRRLVPQWVPLPSRLALKRRSGELDEVLFEIIRARRASPGGDDLLSLLLAARDEDGRAMDDHQLRDESITVFVAGHETTALALSYALWLVATHPEAEARLVEEVDRVLGGRAARVEDVGALVWTEAVVRETMRIHPPAWIIGREASEDVQVGAYTMPRGSQCLIPIYVIHRDPRWYTDPWAFRPERWLGGLAERLPRFAYFPFGGGPRVCVGNHFAMMEAILVLATLYQRATFKQAPGATLSVVPSITLRPRDGVRMEISLRR